jgi:serine/threonine-protein kinase
MLVLMPEPEPPARIDRYEVVGRLAAGGMAEVLLARLRGPHGFEHPVVIKRILPHLALDPDMVNLFLDEARTISALHHPNLIRVHELGSDAQGLYMVMEYLEGESIADICRRQAARDEHIDPEIAAHILAEACAGLHAAHEASDPGGRPLGLVHRDVSPQNIIVTYDGSVHVIDFGIAARADRITRTEAGVVRGKHEYLAPEQCRAEPLDRRADIFALGVVLFELTSGRRVYRRSSMAETFRAILSEPVPRLLDVRAEATAELAAICEKALAKEADLRFRSAGEMRRELRAFVRMRTDDDVAERLGLLMKRLFADRLAEKNEMLRRVRGGDSLVEMPVAAVDPEIEPLVPAPARASRGSRGRRIALATGAGVIVAIALVFATRSARRAPVSPPSAPSSEPAVLAVADAPPSESPPVTAPSLPPAEVVNVHIESSPTAASVALNGNIHGVTPLDLTARRGGAPLKLELRAPGFDSARRVVVPDADKTLRVVLSRSNVSSRTTSTPKPSSAAPASSPVLW